MNITTAKIGSASQRFVMFIVYYVSVSTVGDWATTWANDGVFGDGWHLFGIKSLFIPSVPSIV